LNSLKTNTGDGSTPTRRRASKRQVRHGRMLLVYLLSHRCSS
jgi:hypothetical protein